jgi:hypothetical protein
MAVTPVSRIQRVRTSHDCEWAFDENVWYVITDEHPYLELEVWGRPLVAAHDRDKQRIDQLEHVSDVSSGHFWQRWMLGDQLARDRTMGGFELPLRVPNGIVLRCYVVPSKLLDVKDFLAMVEDVQTELNRPVAWDPGRDRRIRSWTREAQASRVSMRTRLLEDVREELDVAQWLRRSPLLEQGRRRGVLEPSPENGLVSHWGARRGGDLTEAIERIERELPEYRRRSREHAPEGRRGMNEVVASMTWELDELRVLRSRVLHHVAVEDLRAPVTFGPLVQRDHRFRKLLRAFAPPPSEVVSESESRWSQFSPISLNGLFERWGAVWIVYQLRQLGFMSGAAMTIGREVLESCAWRLVRGRVSIEVDYEPHPEMMDFGDVPPIHERDETANEWTVARQLSDDGRTLFGSQTRCSPDYVLRIQGPYGHCLAVGDACLADPAHHPHDGQASKPATVESYRRSIFWWVNGRLQPCDPMGGFVLFPGPPSGWDALMHQVRHKDVWFICPKPRGADEHARQRFRTFVERLIAKVTGPTA